MAKAPGGKKSKVGRNKVKCTNYKVEGRREKNKVRRIAKYNGKDFLEKWKDEHIYKKIGA